MFALCMDLPRHDNTQHTHRWLLPHVVLVLTDNQAGVELEDLEEERQGVMELSLMMPTCWSAIEPDVHFK